MTYPRLHVPTTGDQGPPEPPRADDGEFYDGEDEHYPNYAVYHPHTFAFIRAGGESFLHIEYMDENVDWKAWIPTRILGPVTAEHPMDR